MATLHELRIALQTDPALMESLFQYHYNNGGARGANEYEAKMRFHHAMANPATANVYLGAFLSEYNTMLRQQQPQQRAGPAQFSPTNYSRSMQKMFVIGATGLAAIVLGSMSPDEDVKVLGKKLGTVVVAASVIGGIGAFIKYK